MSDTSDDDSAALQAPTASAGKPSNRRSANRTKKRHIERALRQILKQGSAAEAGDAGAQPTPASQAAGSGGTGAQPTPAANAAGFDAEEAAVFLARRFREASKELIVEIAGVESLESTDAAFSPSNPIKDGKARVKMSQRRRRQARAGPTAEQVVDYAINWADFERNVTNYRGTRCWRGHKLECISRAYEPRWPERCACCKVAWRDLDMWTGHMAVACKTCNFALCRDCALQSGPLEPDFTAPWRR